MQLLTPSLVQLIWSVGAWCSNTFNIIYNLLFKKSWLILKGTQQWSQILWYFGQQGPFNTSIYSKFWFLAWFARNKPKMLKVHATLAWNRVNVSTLCAELVSMFPHCALGWCQCFHIVRWVRVNVSTLCAELASMFPHRALSWRQCFRIKMVQWYSNIRKLWIWTVLELLEIDSWNPYSNISNGL